MPYHIRSVGQIFPNSPMNFGVLGVTNGRSLTKNPCLKSELAWANKGLYAPAFYINLSNPPLLTRLLNRLVVIRLTKNAWPIALDTHCQRKLVSTRFRKALVRDMVA